MALSRRGHIFLALFSLIALSLLCRDVQAQGPQIIDLPDSGSPGRMALSVDSLDSPTAAWWSSRDGRSALLVASGSFERAMVVHTAPSSASADAPLALSRGGKLAWALPYAEAARLYERQPGGAIQQRSLRAMPLALAYGVDDRLYWAGHSAGQVWLASEAQPEPFEVAAFGTVSALTICAGPAGGVTVAVAGVTSEGQSGLYLIPASGQAVRVADATATPRLLCSADGGVHLAWPSPTGLQQASSSDWSAVNTIVAPADAPWALAGDGASHVRLAWAAGEVVYVATSRDWASAPQPLETGPAEAIDLAVSSSGAVQLLWRATARGATAANLRYLAQAAPLRQLRLLPVGPPGGMQPGALWAAVSNLPLSDFVQARFYLTEPDGPAAGAWQQIDQDTDSSDGLTVALPNDLVAGSRYALVAQAVLRDGSHLVCQSEWLVAESGLQAVLALPEESPWRGTVGVRLLPLAERQQEQLFELWLEPLPRETAAAESYYLGAYRLPATAPAGAWHVWPVDARAVPDGHYRLYATRWLDGRRQVLSAAGEAWVDNACSPAIDQVDAEVVGRLQDRLRVTVTASDLNGVVERVDAYLVARSVVGPSGEFSIWLGSDGSSDGGWVIEAPIAPEWRGSSWAVRAIAYDNDDYPSQWAESAAVALPPAGLAVRFLRPASGPVLGANPTITAIIDKGVDQVESASFYLYSQDALQPLGAGEMVGRLVSLEMDVGSLAPGSYRLLAHLQGSGGQSWWPGPELEVSAAKPHVELLGDTDVAPDMVRHEVRAEPPQVLTSVDYALVDSRGEVAQLGVRRAADGDLGIEWDAGAYLPGEYTLLCTLVDEHGQQTQQGWPLRLTAPYGLEGVLPTLGPLQGEAPLDWQAADLPEDLALTVSYSPDGGAHWLPVAEMTPGDVVATLDTTLLPDSRDGRLRLTWRRDDVWGQVDSGPLVINNRPQAPMLTVLEPQPGQVLPAEALIAWEARAADGGKVTVEIAARRGSDAWTPILADVPGTGRHLWATEGLQPGSGWELEITAVGGQGERQSVLISDLTVTRNRPPRVRLLWPDSDVMLNGETAILWSALDLDGDTVAIDLYYSDNAGHAWYPLAEDLPNTGYYLWETAFVPPGNAYRIRVVARDGLFEQRAQSGGLSTMGGAASPDVRLTLPAAEAPLRRTTLVCWQTLRPADLATVQVEAREVRSGAIEPIVAGGPPAGCIPWDTLYVPDGQYALTINARGGDGLVRSTSTRRVSVANLTPAAPEIEWAKAPATGPYGSPTVLSWQTTDVGKPPLAVQLEGSADLGATWRPIKTAPAGAEYTIWGPPPDDGPALLRLRAASDGRSSQSTVVAVHPAPAYSALPELALSMAQSDGKPVVRWLAQDSAQRELMVAVLGVDDLGAHTLLAQGLTEVGELSLDAMGDDRPLVAVCVLADNGHMARMACAGIEDQPPWALELLSPGPLADWADTITLGWRLNPMAGGLPTQQSLWWSDDGRRSWHELAQLDGLVRRYVWTEAGEQSGALWLRIEASDASRSTVYEAGPWLAQQPRQAAAISLVTPQPGQASGAEVAIHWRSAHAPAGATVALWYRTAPNGAWRSLAKELPLAGQFMWDVTSLPNGSQVWLRAEVMTAEGVVARSLTHRLLAQPQALPNVHLSLSGPVLPRATVELCWQAAASRSDAQVRIMASDDGGATWAPLAEGLALVGCRQVPSSALRGELALWRALVVDGNRQGVDTISAAIGQP